MIPRTALSLLALAALALAACGSDDGSPAADDSLPAVGSATADDLADRAFASTAVTGYELVADTTVELAFTADSVGARAGCNSMSGGYTITDGTLEIGVMASTMMACSEELMAQDTWLNEFLSGEPAISLDGGTLTLTGDDASITLAEIEDAPLVGTTWNVTGTVANEAVSSVPEEAVASITIADDGTVAVETGCNSGSGTVEVTDTTMTFGPIAVTKRACTDEAVNQLEASVLAVLQGDVSYEINGDGLSLRKDANGSEIGLELATD
jgi:heat shock protein HslJ